jgi:hypothetical protein
MVLLYAGTGRLAALLGVVRCGAVEAASGIANEKGLMLAECTCSAVFGALRHGGR